MQGQLSLSYFICYSKTVVTHITYIGSVVVVLSYVEPL